MNNLLQTILGAFSQGKGNGQIVEFALNWLFQQPNAVAVCKAMNWDIANLKDAIKGGISYASKAYSERIPFVKTVEQRVQDVKTIYKELQGFACLDELEAMVLASKLAGFNAKEILHGLELNDKMTVEQISNMALAAQEKYSKAAKEAGIGITANNIEQSSNVDLTSVFKSIKPAE